MNLQISPAHVAIAAGAGQAIRDAALRHHCARHRFFSEVKLDTLNTSQIAALLRNYDAHASLLRRLLLKAATIMPDAVVGYVLENVRNEYGNGDAAGAHQLQLRDLARQAQVSDAQFAGASIQDGVRAFLLEAPKYYFPESGNGITGPRAAIAAGAIAATEILALEEFRAMRVAFQKLGLHNHIWFDHITVEADHTDESVQLSLYFIEKFKSIKAVEFGLVGILNANVRLYDGLLSAIADNRQCT